MICTETFGNGVGICLIPERRKIILWAPNWRKTVSFVVGLVRRVTATPNGVDPQCAATETLQSVSKTMVFEWSCRFSQLSNRLPPFGLAELLRVHLPQSLHQIDLLARAFFGLVCIQARSASEWILHRLTHSLALRACIAQPHSSNALVVSWVNSTERSIQTIRSTPAVSKTRRALVRGRDSLSASPSRPSYRRGRGSFLDTVCLPRG